ncbi:MAG: hypothetical protein J6Q74_04110 [Clostridia bacterium]|nr:hypothetical protein [Clostridia bacterium]
MKKFLCITLCAVMIIGVCSMLGWTTGNVWTPEAFDSEAKSNYSKNDEVIASNDKYELMWMGSDCTVDLIEKETGNRWGVTTRNESESVIDESLGIPKKASAERSSLLILDILDLTNNQTDTAMSNTGAVRDGAVVTEKIDNGLRVYYYFKDIQIRVVVDVALMGDRVTFTVDPKLIQEGERYRAVSVKIAPFWCNNKCDDPDAYILYPSGSGAIVPSTGLTSAGVTYEAQVYGEDAAMLKDTQETTTKEVRLPVFGAINKGIGTAAIIEDNAEAATIGVKAGATRAGFSSAYIKFELRGHSTNAVQTMNNGSSRQEVYAYSLGEKPFTVGFYPLTGDKASYSGIAETYRNYLLSTGMLKDKAKEESPLNLTFIGGVMIDKSFLGVPYKDLVPATTIAKAQEILAELKEETKGKISAKLLGFGSTGIEYGDYAGGITLHKNIGSKKELASLGEYSAGNNIDLYFDFDLVRLRNASKGFSTTFDVAYSPLLKITTVYKYNAAARSYEEATGYKLLKRELLDKGANKVLKTATKWNIGGISLESLSQTAYSDYSTETTEYFAKGDMAKDVLEIYSKVKEEYFKVASHEANAYAAVASDIVFDTPSISAGEHIFAYDVPFYQMVFKGYVPMTCESINLASSPKVEVLKAVEAGSGLSYTVISDYHNEFIDYQGYYFFGSQYSDISDGIIATANELSEYYKAISGAEIVSHKVLSSGLRETVFSSGVKAYVNYTDDSIATPSGKTVEAKGYVWEK